MFLFNFLTWESNFNSTLRKLCAEKLKGPDNAGALENTDYDLQIEMGKALKEA